MASEIIGRAPCPECGFEAAHVKRSEKCVYRYCPGCSSQTHARTPDQVKNMTEKMRPVEAMATPGPTPTSTANGKDAPTPQPTATPTATGPTPTSTLPAVAPPKRRGLFS